MFENKAFIAYLTAQDGNTVQYAKALIEGGVDILEIGVPFSDPIADGPVIQQAMQRALKNGANWQSIFSCIEKIKNYADIPIVLFTYLNPLLQGGDYVLEKSRQLNIAGILIVDLALEEEKLLYPKMLQYGLQLVHVITPTTSSSRIKEIEKHNHTFLYYACRKGTTGIKNQLPLGFQKDIKRIKKQIRQPVAVGFGISDKESAKEVLKYADGVVVGSLFVNAIGKGVSFAELKRLALNVNPKYKNEKKYDLCFFKK